MTEFTDCLALITQVKTIIGDPRWSFTLHGPDGGAEAHRIGYRARTDGRRIASIVTAADTALELGSPKHQTVSTLLWTRHSGVVTDLIATAGRDFPDLRETPVGFAQIVMVELDDTFDPTGPNFQALLNLTNRIPGYMTRSIPGKI
ncbi:MAG: hypothetical protein PHY31_01590 [Smithellaceae bacterium]|nr:hypothetical protein [Smithellaceae bacterium]